MVANKLCFVAVIASLFGAVLCGEGNGVLDDSVASWDVKTAITTAALVENMIYRPIPDAIVESLSCNKEPTSGTLKTPALRVPVQILREQSVMYTEANPMLVGYTTVVYNCEAVASRFEYFRPEEFRDESIKAKAAALGAGTAAHDELLYYFTEDKTSNRPFRVVVYELTFNGDKTKDFIFQAYYNERQIAIKSIGSVTGIEKPDPTK